VATQWSGKNYGLLSIPRIGQEVIVQFEDGDPDRPIVTGMMYKADTMPPYVDPAQPTRTGLMTRSSPKGKEDDYNALVMQDEKGKEYVHLQSQKDYQMVVKDSAQITIGDKSVNVSATGQTAEAGSLLQTVEQNVTEVVKKGDKTETIEKGSLTLTVEKDMTETLNSGNMTLDVKKGTIDIDAKGNIDVDSGQNITMTAKTKITLKVGGNSIEISPTGVKIKGTTTVDVQALNTTVKGSAMLTLKGGLTKIN
jgi:type VI secretion system secreted protein VgrG